MVSDVVGPWQAPNSRLSREEPNASRTLFHTKKFFIFLQLRKVINAMILRRRI